MEPSCNLLQISNLLKTSKYNKIALIGNYDKDTIIAFEKNNNLRRHRVADLIDRYIVVGCGMTVRPIRQWDALVRALDLFHLSGWEATDYHNIIMIIDPNVAPLQELKDLLSGWKVMSEGS
jgi:hypothetical protein